MAEDRMVDFGGMAEAAATPFVEAGMALTGTGGGEPADYQEAAFGAQDEAARQQRTPTTGPTGSDMAASGGAMSRFEFLARGGLGNTFKKAFDQVRSGVALEKQKRAYMDLQRRGLSGAKDLYESAVKRYPGNDIDADGISGWVPKPEYYLKTDGSFDTERFHSAFQLGLLKYKESQIRAAKEATAGQHHPAVQKAINEWYSYIEQNPGLSADQAAAAWNRIKQTVPGAENAEMPKEVYSRLGAMGLPTAGQRESRESAAQRAEIAHQRALERIKLNNRYRAQARDAIGTDLNQNQLLNQLRYMRKEALRMSQDAKELRAYERMLKEANPGIAKGYGESAKELEDTAKKNYDLIKDLIETYKDTKPWGWLQRAGADTDFDSIQAGSEGSVDPLGEPDLAPQEAPNQQPLPPARPPQQSQGNADASMRTITVGGQPVKIRPIQR